jgi:hypothetical protein
MLRLLVDDEECRRGLLALTTDMCNGRLPPQAQHLLRLSILVPLDKSGDEGPDPLNPKVRPIAMGEVFLRMASIYVCDLTRDSLAKVLLPINYAVGVQGGSQTAVLLLRALQSEGSHLLSCDFANAFNTVLRSKIFEALAAEPSLSKLAPLAHWLYGSPSSLYVRGQGQELHHIRSCTGARQGCVLGTALFCLAVKPLYERALAAAPSVKAIAICDDITFAGAADDTIKAFDALRIAAQEFGLQLVPEKCFLTRHQRHDGC